VQMVGQPNLAAAALYLTSLSRLKGDAGKIGRPTMTGI
jgi:hypothetical protein